MKRRYRTMRQLSFADGTKVPRRAILMSPHIPAWTQTLLVGCVPLCIQGKVRLVTADAVKEIK